MTSIRAYFKYQKIKSNSSENLYMTNKLSTLLLKEDKQLKILAKYLLIFTFFYLIFKPAQLISINNYFPVYSIALLAGFWMVSQLFSVSTQFSIRTIFITCLLLTLISVFSMFYEEQVDRRSILTWPAWFCVFSLGTVLALSTSHLGKALPRFFKIVITLQTILAMTQLFEPNAFDVLWSSMKTHGLGERVRVTGSMYNPNFFAFIVTFSLAGIIAHRGPEKEYIWVILAYILIILSGSRTLILGYPLVVVSWYRLFSGEKALKALTKCMVILVSLYVFSALVLTTFQDTLKYSSQLLSVIKLDNVDQPIGLNSIRSYQTRGELWNASFISYFNSDWIKILFGSHHGYGNKAHQGFIYILTQFGLIGFILYCFLLSLLLSIAYQIRSAYEGKFLYMTCLLIIGSSLASLASATMTLGIYLPFTAGIAAALFWKLKKNESAIEANKSYA